MLNPAEIAKKIESLLELNYNIVGHYYTDDVPENTVKFKTPGNGCIMSLIFSAANGKTVSFNKDTAGWNCSAYYLGYRTDIFPGIEYFLSNGSTKMLGREAERFTESPVTAQASVDNLLAEQLETRTAIFKPLNKYDANEKPESVIFFVNPDHISALIFLLHYKNPLEFDRVLTGFLSSCAATVTMPLRLARSNSNKVVWGHHDISARTRTPKDLMTLSMPYTVLESIAEIIDDSFVITHLWQEILKRNRKEV